MSRAPKTPKNKPQNFFIASGNAKVREILDKTENKSEYICAAILEKYERDHGLVDMRKPFSRDELRKEMRALLAEMYGENVYIVSGNFNLPTISIPQQHKKTVPEPEKQENVPPPTQDNTEKNRLKALFESL